MKTFSLNCFHSPHLCKALFLFCLFLFFLQAKAADLSDYNRQKLGAPDKPCGVLCRC